MTANISQNFGLEIRKMALFDIEAVHDNECKSFPDPWEKKSFEESLEHCDCFVLSKIINKQVFLSNTSKESESHDIISSPPKKIIGHFIGKAVENEFNIYNFAVVPEYHGQGYGFYFISRILEIHDQRIDRYFLDVRKSNSKAISLYLKLGFKVLYERKGYYQSPNEDALVMFLKKEGG